MNKIIKVMAVSFLFAGALTLADSGPRAEASTNLISNGDFESGGLGGWIIPIQRDGPLVAIIDEEENVYEGGYAARIEIPSPNNRSKRVKLKSQPIVLEKGRDYELSGYIKTGQNVRSAGLAIESGNEGIKILERSENLAGEHSYTKCTIKFRVRGRNAEIKAVAKVRNYRRREAEAWIDRVSVRPLSSTDGPMAGAVTESSAKVWFRVEPGAEVQVEYSSGPEFNDDPLMSEAIITSPENDYTGTTTLTDLAANTIYYYRMIVDGEDVNSPPYPQFKTFPYTTDSVKVGILTDLQSNKEAPAFSALANDNPDFVLVLGDWEHRNVFTLEEMRAMHREVLGEGSVSGKAFRDHILYKFPVAHVWDDHDYGGNNDDKTSENKDMAIQAYDEYWPSYERPNPQAGIWHSFFYGDLVEVFMLDLRSQRDKNTYLDPDYIPDDQSGANREELRDDPWRSMLDGDEQPEGQPKGQKQWLKDELAGSEATWKIIVSTVPWNPTTLKDDAWWDFRAEQKELLEFIKDRNITGVMIVSGDIHTGGAIDDGTSVDILELSDPPLIPEMNVPAVNVGQKHNSRNRNRRGGTSCKLHEPIQQLGCGEWSVGYTAEGRGYGLITLSPASALIEAKDEEGYVVRGEAGNELFLNIGSHQ